LRGKPLPLPSPPPLPPLLRPPSPVRSAPCPARVAPPAQRGLAVPPTPARSAAAPAQPPSTLLPRPGPDRRGRGAPGARGSAPRPAWLSLASPRPYPDAAVVPSGPAPAPSARPTTERPGLAPACPRGPRPRRDSSRPRPGSPRRGGPRARPRAPLPAQLAAVACWRSAPAAMARSAPARPRRLLATR
jgi:hypothetical protein